MGETATVTVVFTDLVGSTTLRSRLGEESADELRRAHDAALTEVIEAHGGRVIKGGGDGLLCVFDAASDALTASVGMQERIVLLGRERNLELSIRIGSSVGDVTFEDDDCFGMPVVEAARLEAAAGPGQIVCSEFVRVMARGRGDHEFMELGELDLKGLDEPVAAYEVKWTAPEAKVDAQQVTPYVGRSEPLAAMRSAYAAATDGAGSVVLISADAGMGKSRLIAEFEADLDEALVIHAVCQDGHEVAHGPLSSALVRWADVDPRGLMSAFGPAIASLTPIAPELVAMLDVDAPPPVAPELEQRRLLDGWERGLRHAAADQPVVLIVDDLHWADRGTVDFLTAAARLAPQLRLIVVGAYRGGEVVGDHPLAASMAALLRDTAPTVLELRPLDEGDVGSLLRELAGGRDVPADFTALMSKESGGNPLFIRESLLQLVAEGRLRQIDGEWVADGLESLELPEVMRHVLERRVGALSERAQSLLTVGALFDAGFPLEATREVAHLDEDAALDAIDEALAAQIIVATDVFDTYRFTHAMFRHALSEAFGPSRKPRAHRHIAEALIKVNPGDPSPALAATIAGHYAASSDLPGAERGVAYAMAWGHAASKAASHLDALAAFGVARDLMLDGDERAEELLLAIARSSALARLDTDEIVRTAADYSAHATRSDDVAGQLVDIARIRHSEDVETAWRIGDLAREHHSGERDEPWVTLRGFELAERDWRDPHHVGFPLLTPERRELMDVSTRLRVPPPFGSGVYETTDRLRTDLEFQPPLDRGLALAFMLGVPKEGVGWLELALDEARDSGDVGTALFAIAGASRCRFLFGEFDRVEALVIEGMGLLDKVGPLSNPAMQFGGAVTIFEGFRSVRPSEEAVNPLNTLFESLSPDIAWLQALAMTVDLGDIMRTRDRAALRSTASRILDAIEGCAPGTPNLPYLLSMLGLTHAAVDAEPDPRLPQLMKATTIDAGFGYAEVDPHGFLGLCAGLAGRLDEARSWFEQSHRANAERGTVVNDAYAAMWEARFEFQPGVPGGSARFREVADEATQRFEALRGFEPLVAYVRDLVAAQRDGGDLVLP